MDITFIKRIPYDIMIKLNAINLELLHIGVQKETFDENDIKRIIGNIDTGRILDALGILYQEKLLDGIDGSFKITDIARKTLWDTDIPLQTRILRLLDIRSCSIQEISKYLLITDIQDELELLSESNLIMFSPHKTQKGLEKIYEILSKGTECLDIVKSGQILEMLQDIKEIKRDVKESRNKDKIHLSLDKIKDYLECNLS